MTKKTLSSSVTAENESLSRPTVLRGSDLDQFSSRQGLGLIERSTAFGVNTAAMYGVKNADQTLKAPLSILLRLYAAFTDKLPKTWTPEFEDLLALINKIDPDFKSYQIGPLLGLDKNSTYRIKKDGIANSKESTKILASLIFRLLQENPDVWPIIRQAVDVEAEARGVPVGEIWVKGKWNKHESESAETTGIKKGPRSSQKNSETAPEQGKIKKQIIWKD
ncbi:hypothetical protein SJI00_20830 [Pseudomonas sp. RP23018S]|uniref:hypothetical protein n=1 Tax=Pseudomonas sp. RP23018S TaxID=3096037 RepID=UPI002ACA6314|nr:hypothetical protein [Pseudomonas sp. RP23018S]MDZ5605221.1 hypothetical protein [Pseudomonas sp. RP23018S]